jgi:hypothetical protein
MSQISVDSVIPQSGTTITIGGSSDTVNLGSGASTNGFLPSAISVSGTDFQFNSGYGSTATAYGCRAWVNFNGTGTVAIRASGNVSSITDNATGSYTVNFTTAMPDANYAGVVSGGASGGVLGRTTVVNGAPAVSAPTTSAFRLRFTDLTSEDDVTYAQAAFFR